MNADNDGLDELTGAPYRIKQQHKNRFDWRDIAELSSSSGSAGCCVTPDLSPLVFIVPIDVGSPLLPECPAAPTHC